MRNFSLAQGQLLEAICDRIIPADQDPGATAAGVTGYIDQQLSGPLARYLPAYQAGLTRFDPACVEATGSGFLTLAPEQRTAFLERVEANQPPGLAGFFNMVIDHTMQGFYGSPAHGGNRHQVSWKMLGIEEYMQEGPHRHGERG